MDENKLEEYFVKYGARKNIDDVTVKTVSKLVTEHTQKLLSRKIQGIK